MSRLNAEIRATGRTGSDPGSRARQAAAMMLRLAVGLSLLNAGVARQLGLRMTNQVPGLVMMEAPYSFLSALASAQIGLGIALIVGFLIPVAAALACVLLLVLPAYQMVMEVGAGGFGVAASDPYVVAATQMLPMLMIPNALVLLFSEASYHPISVDALIFARSERTRAIRPPVAVVLDEPRATGEGEQAGQSSGG